LATIAAKAGTGVANIADGAATIEGMIDVIRSNAGSAASGATIIAIPTIRTASDEARTGPAMQPGVW
jgi:hypothetical protein